FVFLSGLPRTANGKVDRRALPAPDLSRAEVERTYVAPRNAVEETLAGIWAGVLRRERVGVHDNFFELGGDSILSIQVIARAHQAGLPLTAKDLFQHQTIAGLAVLVSNPWDLATGTVPLTPVQHRFFAQDLRIPSHCHQAVFLEVRQSLDQALLEQAVRK